MSDPALIRLVARADADANDLLDVVAKLAGSKDDGAAAVGQLFKGSSLRERLGAVFRDKYRLTLDEGDWLTLRMEAVDRIIARRRRRF